MIGLCICKRFWCEVYGSIYMRVSYYSYKTMKLIFTSIYSSKMLTKKHNFCVSVCVCGIEGVVWVCVHAYACVSVSWARAWSCACACMYFYMCSTFSRHNPDTVGERVVLIRCLLQLQANSSRCPSLTFRCSNTMVDNVAPDLLNGLKRWKDTVSRHSSPRITFEEWGFMVARLWTQ